MLCDKNSIVKYYITTDEYGNFAKSLSVHFVASFDQIYVQYYTCHIIYVLSLHLTPKYLDLLATFRHSDFGSYVC